MNGGDRPYDAALNAIQTLRAWGATSVRLGDIAVTFGPSLLPDGPETAKTQAELDAEHDRHLFGSADR